MFPIICTLAVLFLIAKKNVNNDGVSIFCIIAFLITGICLVDILNIYGFFAVVLPILLTVILMVLAIKSSSSSASSGSTSSAFNSEISESDPAVEALIKEATEIINDFLEVGLAASMFSDSNLDFSGHIIVVADARPPFSGKYTNYGIHISMHNPSDLRTGAERYPKMYRNNPLQAEKLDHFLYKYGSMYNYNEKAYDVRTSRTVPIRSGKHAEAEREKLRTLVLKHVAKECPLSEYNGSLLYNKSVYH